MPNTNISPNMNLPIPVVGVDPGPDWASNLNASLTLIDQHNHSSGSGVQITPTGININADFAINQNNLTSVKTVRYQAQSAAITAASPNLNCTYVAGVDLYYNDGSGNQVQITSGGNVVGNVGNITGLTSPASASYNSINTTFVWESDVSTPANMDFGSAIFRNITANSNGITISPPSALASNYTLTLPALPASQSFMTLDNSGNIAAPWTVDNSTLAISGSNVIVKNLGINTAQLANGAVTVSKLAALGQQESSSSGSFVTSSSSPVDVTNLTVTITTTGRPVLVHIQPVESTNLPGTLGTGSVTDQSQAFFYLLRDGTVIASYQIYISTGFSRAFNYQAPSITYLDVSATAGSHTYKVQASGLSGSESTNAENVVLIAWEL